VGIHTDATWRRIKNTHLMIQNPSWSLWPKLDVTLAPMVHSALGGM
jgi:hypothetical protein